MSHVTRRKPALCPPQLFGACAPAALAEAGRGAVRAIALRPGQAWYLALYGILTFGTALTYAAYLFNRERAAEQLQQYGGTIESVSPGEASASHLDAVVSRLTLIGACYLVLVVVGLQIVAIRLRLAPLINGTALLLLLCITLDISAQVRELWRRPRRGKPRRDDRNDSWKLRDA